MLGWAEFNSSVNEYHYVHAHVMPVVVVVLILREYTVWHGAWEE